MGSIIGRIMEGEELMDLWEKQNIDFFDKDRYCQQMYYYKRKMGNGPSSIQMYYVNIFICVFSSAKQLIDNWEKIHYNIAFHVQSKDESMIEKSNYYICMFVKESIDTETKSLIQSDSFCAKKYIFEGNITEEKDLIEIVEQRIFRLSVSDNNQDRLKMTQIELKNFRRYQGDFKINLCGQDGTAAAFTLIYAKNGLGKTSLFDGIEYVLKGEISRITDIEKLNKNEPIKGAVYHNWNCIDQKASVEIQLDNGRRILREVKNIKDNKSDIGCKSVGKYNGKDIVGEDKEQWNQIILPHDKIDSFISAKTPAQQYDEWTKSTPELKEYRDNFIELHKKLKDKRLEISRKETELLECQKELKTLEQSKTEVCTLITLCKEYNSLIKKENYLIFDIENSDGQSYDLFCNNVLKELRNIDENILPLYNVKLQKGKKIQQGAIKDTDTLLMAINNAQDEKDARNCRIQCKTKYDHARKHIEEIINEINIARNQIKPLQEICQYGLEKVESSKERYVNLKREIEATEQTIQYFENELQKNRDLIKSLNTNRITMQDTISSTEIEQKLQKIGALREIFKNQDGNIQNIILEIRQIEARIKINESTVCKIDEIVLPLKLNKVCLNNMPDIGLILSKEEQDKLKGLEVRMHDVQKEFDLRKQILNQKNTITDEVRELCKSGMTFLMANRNEKKCPLCKTTFENWEELVSRVSLAEEDYGEQERQKLQEILKNMEQLDKEYEIFYTDCNRKKERIIKEIVEMNKRAKQEKDEKESQQNRCQKEREETQQEIEEMKNWFNQKKISLTDFTEEEWNEFRREAQSKIQEINIQLAEVEENNKSLESLKENNKQSKNFKTQELESIVNDSQLYKYILFLQNNMYGCDIKKENKVLLERINELESDKMCTEEVIEQNKSYSMIDIKEEQNKILQCNERLDNLNKLNAEVTIFKEFSPRGVEESMKLWENEVENCKKQRELLNQMKEENGARYYFEKNKLINAQKTELERQLSDMEDKEKILDEEFKEEKNRFEISLKDYFSQAIINEIFQKIDPHDIMKNITYHLNFNEKDEPQLFINVFASEKDDNYRPEAYFSTAQLNTVAFSSFFGRALSANSTKIKTICIDDPIGHFDDMNILGFTDMIRCILETQDCQIIMSTHDKKIYEIMQRKLNNQYYNTSFIRLADSEKVSWTY